ncbi:hypothetical protein TEA_001746 [Camellia sinensis var. sinensis]|uniref:t-SNARE coiled-coil homology domain-containing protein n=1 Tax=Camellia sinensis var. sinensis TaxID=542762 RepID=A0A4S4D8N1_CAMSN|nr:hypothetical protein TEA_001746 [Camellia sinensis var. sinensis]
MGIGLDWAFRISEEREVISCSSALSCSAPYIYIYIVINRESEIYNFMLDNLGICKTLLLSPPSLTAALPRLRRKSEHLLLRHRHRHREYRRSFHAASSSTDLHRSTATATRSRGFIAEMNSAPLMLRLADLKNAKEDLSKNCVALYEASSGDGSLNDDDWEAIADRAPEELLSPQCLPEVSKLSLQDAKTQTPKRRGRGMFAYTTHRMYSDQQSHGFVVGNSENEAMCDSSEGDTQIRNDAMREELRQEWKGDGRQLGEGIWMDFLLHWICISFSQSEASGVDGRRTGAFLSFFLSVYRHKTRYHIGQLVKEASIKLKQPTETNQHIEVSASKKIADAKLAKDFQAVLREFQKGLKREQGIEEIQQQIGEVNEIFKDLAVLVHEQGVMIDDISSNIESSHAGTARATCHFIYSAWHNPSKTLTLICRVLLRITFLKDNAYLRILLGITFPKDNAYSLTPFSLQTK